MEDCGGKNVIDVDYDKKQIIKVNQKILYLEIKFLLHIYMAMEMLEKKLQKYLQQLI